MTEHNSETEIEAGQADEAFTDELSDEALDRGEEGRASCILWPVVLSQDTDTRS